MLKTVIKPLKNKQGSEQVPEHSHDKLVKMSTERSHEVLRHWLPTGFYILTTEVKVSTAWYWPQSCAPLLQHKLDSEQFKKQNKKPERKTDEKSPVDLAQMPTTVASDDLPGSNCGRWDSNNQPFTSAAMKSQQLKHPTDL